MANDIYVEVGLTLVDEFTNLKPSVVALFNLQFG